MPTQATPRRKTTPKVSSGTLQLVRTNVQDLLMDTPAFRELTPEQQRQIAHDTVDVCSYLAEPEGMRGDRVAAASQPRTGQDPYAFPLAGESAADASATPKFTAQAAREGAAVAGALLQAVNFP